MNGLFIQMSNLPPEPWLDQLLTHVTVHHHEIKELVFTDVAGYQYQRLFTNPLLQGKRFKLFIGCRPIPWSSGQRYDQPTDLQEWMKPVMGVGGMLTPSYRWEQIGAEHAAAIAPLTYGGQTWNWYIGQEVGLDAVGDHTRLREAWQWYLQELCGRIHKIAPGRDILWSPYIWDAWSTFTLTRKDRVGAMTRVLLAYAKSSLGTPGITMLDLQDGRGSQPAEPETDALNWYHLLINHAVPTNLRINMEYFKTDPVFGYTPQTIEEMTRRDNYYKTNAIPIGNCWEARYWMVPMYNNHTH